MSLASFKMGGRKYSFDDESLKWIGEDEQVAEMLDTFIQERLFDLSVGEGDPYHILFEYVVSQLGEESLTQVVRPSNKLTPRNMRKKRDY